MKTNIQFERGDVVRLVSTRPLGWACGGEMDKFLDSVQVINTVTFDGYVSFINPSTQRWNFCISDIAKYENHTLLDFQLTILAEAYAAFPEGTKFLSAMSNKRFTSKGLLFPKIENEYFNILDQGNNYIYYRGKWAGERESKLMFNEHKVTYDRHDSVLSVGCKDIDPDDLYLLLNLVKDYNITSIVVDGVHKVTPSDLVKWDNFINKQS